MHDPSFRNPASVIPELLRRCATMSGIQGIGDGRFRISLRNGAAISE